MIQRIIIALIIILLSLSLSAQDSKYKADSVSNYKFKSELRLMELKNLLYCFDSTGKIINYRRLKILVMDYKLEYKHENSN